MQNKLVILATVLALGGCGATAPVIQTVIQKVEVPIAVPCKAEEPSKPDFNFDKLKEEDNIFDKSKAVLADRKLHQSYETELGAALKSCK